MISIYRITELRLEYAACMYSDTKTIYDQRHNLLDARFITVAYAVLFIETHTYTFRTEHAFLQIPSEHKHYTMKVKCTQDYLLDVIKRRVKFRFISKPTSEKVLNAFHIAVKVHLSVLMRNRHHLRKIDQDWLGIGIQYNVEFVEVSMNYAMISQIDKQSHHLIV